MDKDLLRKEIVYRMSYRGTLELDTLCRVVLPYVTEMEEEKLLAVRDLMLEREGDLMLWLIEGGAVPPERREVVGWMKELFKKHHVAGRS